MRDAVLIDGILVGVLAAHRLGLSTGEVLAGALRFGWGQADMPMVAPDAIAEPEGLENPESES